MAFLDKVYTLYKSENFDGFLATVALPEDVKAKLATAKQTQKVVKSGDEYTMTLSMDDIVKVSVFKSGEEKDDEAMKGSVKYKNFLKVDGNTIEQVLTFPSGSKINIKREFNGDELVMSITSTKFDGVARRYFKV